MDRQENGSYLKCGRPVTYRHVSRLLNASCLGRYTLEDIETDAAKLINVGVVDFGQEPDLWWGHWVVIWEEKLELENATWLSH